MIKVMKKSIRVLILGILYFSFIFPLNIFAQSVNVDASKLRSRVEVYFSPRSGSFSEGSTFDVPILINTKGNSINGIEITVNFDRNKLSIVRPSGGTSIIGVWVEPPSFDNSKGIARYVGVIPGGITTGSGLIGNITFQAKSIGNSVVSFASNSKVLLNDGLGTEAIVGLGRAEYNILPSAPGGVNIFSDTHPFQSDWYNNKNPVFSWDKDSNVEGFSFILDNKPNTVPENIINTNNTQESYENLTDGLWYFHIKASKGGVWGSTGHYLVRIDTAPPASFKPEVNYLLASTVLVERTLVSFFTTDNLSGVDHYEVGIIDKSEPTTVSPVFIQAESPFQVPLVGDSNLQVIVRAVDKAGNIRDESIDVAPPVLFIKFLEDNLMWILLGILFVLILGMIIHYYAGHHIKRGVKKVQQIIYNKEPIYTNPVNKVVQPEMDKKPQIEVKEEVINSVIPKKAEPRVQAIPIVSKENFKEPEAPIIVNPTTREIEEMPIQLP